MIDSYQTKQEQNLAWKKIYTSYVAQCQKSITYDDSVKIFTQIRNNEFNFEQYRHVYENTTLEDFKNVELKFTSDEERLWGYIQDFEKTISEKAEEEEYNNNIKNFFDREPNVFGFSLSSTKWLQYIMMLCLIAGIFYLLRIVMKGFQEPPKK